MPNTHHIDLLIKVLSSIPEGNFHMERWISGSDGEIVEPNESISHAVACGTVACIGGWCEILSNVMNGGGGISDHAGGDLALHDVAHFLGINHDLAERLCYPWIAYRDSLYDWPRPAFVSRADAIEQLECIRDHGYVSWNLAKIAIPQHLRGKEDV